MLSTNSKRKASHQKKEVWPKQMPARFDKTTYGRLLRIQQHLIKKPLNKIIVEVVSKYEGLTIDIAKAKKEVNTLEYKLAEANEIIENYNRALKLLHNHKPR